MFHFTIKTELVEWMFIVLGVFPESGMTL